MSESSSRADLPSLRVQRVRVTLRQQVLELLRNAILEGRFKPGERLVERELCELTGVSRTSVREALRHLESEGLVANVPNKGPTVATVSEDDAREIYEVREALEALAGRLFAERGTARQVDALQGALDRLAQAFAQNDLRLVVAETTQFYDVFLDGCGNSLIRDMIRSLQARVIFLRATSIAQPGRAPGSLTEMEHIVQAIRRRDPDGAEAACRDHVRRARAAAFEMLRRRRGA
jgi:DNA-binding GntR family transcriptional regulator